ncbi:DNA-binding protein [Sandaracinomonas limnophila]|uniref:DNA-binding protein n=2 Tax=Sandaracinomonas limnophila TaxID=1862386 RepID=A0A437PPX1_9BACT|nr:DNA-binding protein [Sandaracinomonas limnophila]
MDGNILELKLARPALRALVNEGIYTLEKLKTKTQVEIANLHGMGPSAIQKLVVFLKK